MNLLSKTKLETSASKKGVIHSCASSEVCDLPNQIKDYCYYF